jgi:hypothetical protein
MIIPQENTDLNLKINIDTLKSKLMEYNQHLELNKNTPKIQTSNVNIAHNYENQSEIFIKEYSSSKYVQYAFTYSYRLMEVSPHLSKQAKEKWKNCRVCDNILDLKGKVNKSKYLIFIFSRQ